MTKTVSYRFVTTKIRSRAFWSPGTCSTATYDVCFCPLIKVLTVTVMMERTRMAQDVPENPGLEHVNGKAECQ